MGTSAILAGAAIVTAASAATAATNDIVTAKNNRRRAKTNAREQEKVVKKKQAEELEMRKASIDQQREQIGLGQGQSVTQGTSTTGIPKATIPTNREVLG